MRGALIAPLLLAAGLLCVSGLAKLRAPHPAVAALTAIGLPARAWLVRLAAVAELALGAAAAATGGRAAAAALASVYAAFCLLSLALARHRAACGCFGNAGAPATRAQAALSAVLAVACAAAAATATGGLGTVFDHGALSAATLLVGLTGAVYGAVLAYIEVPRAWGAWSGR